MAIELRYTAGISYVEEPEVKARLERIAESEKISLAQVMREVVRLGLPLREASSE